MTQPTTYVGMDDHKERIQLSIRLGHSRETTRCTIPNDADAVSKTFRKLVRASETAVVACYEAGPSGYVLQRWVNASGARCLVVAPSLTPRRPGQRVKTDRRDADKLSELLAAGMLVEVQPPTPAEEAVRDLCRCRQAAKADLVRSRQRLVKLLLRRGLVYRSGQSWTKRHRQWLWSLHLQEAADQVVLDDSRLAIDQLEVRLLEIERHLEAVAAEQPYCERVGWLRCFRGVDTVTALSFLAELHGIERFHTARQLMAFLGLVPSEASSGERQRRGSITKSGNTRVRKLLVEAAWHCRHRPAVGRHLRARRSGQPAWAIALADRAQQRLYQRHCRLLLARGKPHNVVTVALARELAGFLWAALRRGSQTPALHG